MDNFKTQMIDQWRMKLNKYVLSLLGPIFLFKIITKLFYVYNINASYQNRLIKI